MKGLLLPAICTNEWYPPLLLKLQLYSLGVANPETGVLAVHVVASDAELAEIEAGGGDTASRRVAEALLFVTSMTMLKATGQVRGLRFT